MPDARWRACAEVWSQGDADPNWYGKWGAKTRALKQAVRWARDEDHGLEVVWIESDTGERHEIEVGG